jgi:hypothetical protein
LVTEHVHGNLNAALSEPLFGVGTEAWNIELLGAYRRIAVKGSLEFVLKVTDHDLLDESVDASRAILAVEVRFVGKEFSKMGAEALVDVAGSVETALVFC